MTLLYTGPPFNVLSEGRSIFSLKPACIQYQRGEYENTQRKGSCFQIDQPKTYSFGLDWGTLMKILATGQTGIRLEKYKKYISVNVDIVSDEMIYDRDEEAVIEEIDEIVEFERLLARIEKMIVQVRNSVLDGLDLLTWMDKKTKQEAINKVESIVDFVAYPEWVLNDEEMENRHRDILSELRKSQSFLEDIVKTRTYQFNLKTLQLKQKPDRKMYESSNLILNLYFYMHHHHLALIVFVSHFTFPLNLHTITPR
ncbi:Endothelin-converting enzyme [Nymphon striatum]|nr:Endothelin-converting enzyme [Nymphon striatum]